MASITLPYDPDDENQELTPEEINELFESAKQNTKFIQQQFSQIQLNFAKAHKIAAIQFEDTYKCLSQINIPKFNSFIPNIEYLSSIENIDIDIDTLFFDKKNQISRWDLFKFVSGTILALAAIVVSIIITN